MNHWRLFWTESLHNYLTILALHDLDIFLQIKWFIGENIKTGLYTFEFAFINLSNTAWKVPADQIDGISINDRAGPHAIMMGSKQNNKKYFS